MDKATEMGKVSATGSYHLFLGKTASTVILAVGTIVLSALIMEKDYGLYAVALIPAATILMFQDLGVSSAIIRYCAQYRATNEKENLHKTIIAGLTFALGTGAALTVISVLTANLIASSVFGKPQSALLITFASISILSISLFNMAQSIFVGFERMKLNSLVLVCYAITQSLLAPLLVFFGYGALGAIIGYTVGYVVASTFSVLLLYFAIFRKLGKTNTKKLSIVETLKPLLRYGVPLGVAAILGGLLSQVYSFAMASYIDPAMIGNYKVATNFALLLTLFTVPISTALFPAFSKLDPKNERQLLNSVFASSVKYTAFLLVPATVALALLSKPIIGTLYGVKWLNAPPFLALAVLGNLFIIFGSLSVPSLLSAVGETKLILKLNVVTLIIGTPLAFILIPRAGITGLIIGLLIANLPSVFIGLYAANKKFGARIDFNFSARLIIASAFAAAPTYILLTFLNAASWIQLAAGTLLFLTIFLTAAPLVGVVTQTDINNLRNMLSSLGIISMLLNIPLLIMEKMLPSAPASKSPPTKLES